MELEVGVGGGPPLKKETLPCKKRAPLLSNLHFPRLSRGEPPRDPPLEEPRDADFPGIFNGIPRTFSHLLARSRMPAQTFLAFLAFLESMQKFAQSFSCISHKPSRIFSHFSHLLASSRTFSHFLAIFENFSHLLAYRGSSSTSTCLHLHICTCAPAPLNHL